MELADLFQGFALAPVLLLAEAGPLAGFGDQPLVMSGSGLLLRDRQRQAAAEAVAGSLRLQYIEITCLGQSDEIAAERLAAALLA